MVAAIDWSKWSAIGTLVAAFATLGLACVTLWLVVVTKRMVGAGRDELTATKDLAAQTRRQALIAATALSVQLELGPP